MTAWQKITAEGSTEVPVKLFSAQGEAKAALVMLPALGVQARFYGKLSEVLSNQGVSTVLLEQRGHGESTYRAKRGEKFGYDDYLNIDIPAAIGYARVAVPGVPLYLGGHSLGGHLSSITAGYRPADIAGVLHIACGFPYHGLYAEPSARRIRKLCFLLPAMTLLFGHFPGEKLGFGGREYSQLMMDWRDWALHGSYDYGHATGVEEAIAGYTGRVLSLGLEGDMLASDQAVEYAYSRFRGAEVTHKKLGETEQGQHLGHFDWARKPDGVAREIVSWIEAG